MLFFDAAVAAQTANILVDKDKVLKVADFGIARLIDSSGRVAPSDSTAATEFAITGSDLLGSGGSGNEAFGDVQMAALGSGTGRTGGTSRPNGAGDQDLAFTPQVSGRAGGWSAFDWG